MREHERADATGSPIDPRERYPALESRVDRRSERFRANDEANRRSLERLAEALEKARVAGGERARAKHVDAGKLLPRERVDRLLDPGSYFLEIAPLAGHEVSGHASGASVIGGVGIVSGVECLITASEATVKGGAMSELSVVKTTRLSDIAAENGLPSVSLIESAGADLPNQSKIFVPGGRVFRDITRHSTSRAPSVCLVFGSSTAGGAYVPGMSDYVVMVKKQAQVYLGGPPLVKMATGEETTHEELGGAEMHARVSGVSDYLAEDEHHAIRLGREIVAHFAWEKRGRAPLPVVEEPIHPIEDLLGIASSDVRIPFSAKEVIARVVDGSRFSEFKPLYGPELVCGFAHVHGYPVAILANDGILFTASANKGAQFIELANQRSIPLIFLQNIVGFMVGRRYEEEGIIKAGAKMINAVSNSTVPAITIMTGASYGAGNYAMSGRAYAPRFLFSWPNHRIAVMGGKQLAGVLDIIQREAAEKRGLPVDEEKLGVMKQMIEAQVELESDPFFATARVWDDGIIDPRDTRSVLGICLSVVHTRPVEGTMRWGVFRH